MATLAARSFREARMLVRGPHRRSPLSLPSLSPSLPFRRLMSSVPTPPTMTIPPPPVPSTKTGARRNRKKLPGPKLTLNRKAGLSAVKSVGAYKFSSDGSSERVNYSLTRLQGVHTRDLLQLDIFQEAAQTGWSIMSEESLYNQLPVILPRKNCVIIRVSHIKIIVLSDHAVLLDVHRPVVRHFADYLGKFLQVVHSHENPLFALHNEQHFGSMQRVPGLPDKRPASGRAREQRERDGDVSPDRPMDFEFRVLEAVLSYITNKYERRVQMFQLVVNGLLGDLFLSPDDVNKQALHRLLPLTNSLHAFERNTKDLIDVYTELLTSEEDMLEMFITEKVRLSGQLPPMDSHGEVELLLESYLREMTHLRFKALALRKKMQNSQDLVAITLDNYRNRMIELNVRMAMTSVALSSGTLGVGIFGMNLVSGLEAHPTAFWMLSGAFLAAPMVVYRICHNIAMPSTGETSRVADIKALQPFMDSVGDIQDSMLTSLQPSTTLDQVAFKDLLQRCTGQPVAEADVELVFRCFDSDKDGVLSEDDVVRFLCDVHSLHAGAGSSHAD